MRTFESIQGVPNIVALPIREHVTPDIYQTAFEQVKLERDSFHQRLNNSDLEIALYFGNWWGYVQKSFMTDKKRNYYYPDSDSKVFEIGDPELAHLYSDLRKRITHLDYYIEVKHAIDQAGLSRQTVTELLAKVTEGTEDNAYEKMHEYLLPAYVHMRARGFTWLDLWQ